jgi:beta-alanine degradation protein BauB
MNVPPDQEVGTRLLFANEVVRVWEMRLAPGEASPLHHHGCDYLIAYASGLDAEILLGDERTTASFESGHVAYYPVGPDGSLPQQLTNIGRDEHLHFVVELVGTNEAAPPSDNVQR